jgi:predicted ATPase/DNA-binding winged helix-turn-helix (wHTH) protein
MRLRSKVFQVLLTLLEHRDHTVLKQELCEQVWPQQFISDATLESTVRAARQAIGDSGRAQQLIQTVYGYGYRFVAAVEVCADVPPGAAGEALRSLPGSVSAPPPGDALNAALVPLTPGSAGDRFIAPVAVAEPYAGRHPTAGTSRLPQRATFVRSALFVGREDELAQVHQWFSTALQGQRQVGFITGAAGIGKTALVDAFVAQLSPTEALWVGYGQCLEPYGPGEPYLPVLEALGRLCRGAEGAPFLAWLRQYAPSWLVQMPALLPPADREALQQNASGATPARMLLELAEALDRLTAERPLVLVLEDLQWSDVSTVAWLSYVARRRDPARLLILGTYRPVDAMVRAHPVRTVMTELTQHQQGAELPLDYLSEADVAAYCRQRLRAQALPAALTRVLHQRSSGHPLFLVTIVDEMIRQGLLREGTAGGDVSKAVEAIRGAVPESLRQIIEQQLHQVSPEDCGLLEAASIAGREFSAAAVAAAVNRGTEDIEARLDVLAQHGQFVRSGGLVQWPDGTVAAGYGFLHDLYREILAERVPPSRKRRWHLEIGARKETAYGARAREMAAELAGHYVQGRDLYRAVQYLQYAGEHALQRSAHREAVTHLTQGIALLAQWPETPARAQQELRLQTGLGPALMVTKGFGHPEVERTYARARALCQQVGDAPQLFPVLSGLWRFANGRAQHQQAWELGEHLLAVAQQSGDPALRLQAHHALWTTASNMGAFPTAKRHIEQGLALYSAQQHHAQTALYGGHDPGVCGRSYTSQLVWLLGYPDQAARWNEAALTLAQELAHPFTLGHTLLNVAAFHKFRRDAPRVYEWAQATRTLGRAQGSQYLEAQSTVLLGWALAVQGQSTEGITQIHQGLAALAEALTLVATTGGRKEEAELHRLKGELLWQAGTRPEEAEACLHQALDVARRQQAKSLELRAAMSLSRLWQSQGKRAEAYQLLAEVYGWFTEGFNTADLQEAKVLLEELS